MIPRRRDNLEAWANAVIGFGVSVALTVLLRAVGVWDASAVAVSAAFFISSYARARILRWAFRRAER